MIRKVIALGAIAAALSACGTYETDRALTGAGIGAAGGAVLGPVGALAGAGAGAAAGAVTEPEDINLGQPLWQDPTFWD